MAEPRGSPAKFLVGNVSQKLNAMESWQALQIGDEGYVLNANAHDSVLEWVGSVNGSICMAWRTPEGHLQALRADAMMTTMFFASGLVLNALIGGVYLRSSQTVGAKDDFLALSEHTRTLRRQARTYMRSAEWFLEFEVIIGERMLVAGSGDTAALKTKRVQSISEVLDN